MIVDQLGRASLQFDVVLSAIVTPIETGLAAMGVQVPAVINDVYFNSAILPTCMRSLLALSISPISNREIGCQGKIINGNASGLRAV